MAPAIAIPDPSSPSAPTASKARQLLPGVGPRTIEELIRARARQDCSGAVVVSYPRSGLDYADYSAQQLSVFASRAAINSCYARIPRRVRSEEPERVVAVLAASNLDYLVSIIALSRLGFTVLFLSTRISDAAYLELLRAAGCVDIVVQPGYVATANRLCKELPELTVYPMVVQELYGQAITTPKNEKEGKQEEEVEEEEKLDQQLQIELDPEVENTKIAWIIHSSGSTGLPKPIFQTHSAALNNYAQNFGLKGFITLPLYHAHGLSSVFRAIHSGKQIWMYNADLPLTGPYIIESMKWQPPEIFNGVPYALKLLAESEEGLEILRKCKIVLFGGSSCPDVLGDKLVRNGVMLVSHYGTTETGQLMTSFREAGDLDWNYLKVSTSLAPYIRWEEQGVAGTGTGTGIFELVVLPGWPSKVATNRDDGGYATKDLFEQHPSKPDRWKYYGRLDDTLTLINGEKANPVPLEHTIRENQFVAEAVVFGAGKPQLGALVVPAKAATAGLDEKAVLEKIWPSVEAANRDAPAYAQLAPEAVRLLPPETEYPRTDKGTVIRAAFYREFAAEIEELYAGLDAANLEGGLELSREETKDFIKKVIVDVLNLPEGSTLESHTDFFSLGMDSLQAMRARLAIQKTLSTGGKALGQNIVFEKPSIEELSSYLYALRTNTAEKKTSNTEVMAALIEKYSSFTPHTPGTSSSTTTTTGSSILVTGATGSLGAHIVASLARRTDIEEIYCLVRAPSALAARRRVLHSLHARRVFSALSIQQRKKIRALPADLGRADLGLSSEVLDELRQKLATVIHCAWAVNFNWDVTSFEAQHIAGIHNLITLCLSSSRSTPATFNFCSSVSAVAASPGAQVAEATEFWLPCAQDMGYARSKLVAENICALAARKAGAASRVLRIGQVVGDTAAGIWNDTEAIPLMVRSALTIGALPELQEDVAWLPVDTVAASVVELSLLGREEAPLGAVFNIVNPQKMNWTEHFLPALEAAEVTFQRLPQREWLQKLRQSEPDPEKNPPIKLLDFWTRKYGHPDDGGDGDEEDGAGKARLGSLTYRTDLARSLSPALHSAPTIGADLVAKFVRHWLTECRWDPSSLSSSPWAKIIYAAPGVDLENVAQGLGMDIARVDVSGRGLDPPAVKKVVLAQAEKLPMVLVSGAPVDDVAWRSALRDLTGEFGTVHFLVPALHDDGGEAFAAGEGDVWTFSTADEATDMLQELCK